MSTKFKIDGCPVVLAIRNLPNRKYTLYFARDSNVTLSRLKKINWRNPTIEIENPGVPGDICLPEGYGFRLEKLEYSSIPDQWTAEISVAEEFLGDVTGYQAQIADMNRELADADREKNGLLQQLSEADELAISLYEAQLAEQKNVQEGMDA